MKYSLIPMERLKAVQEHLSRFLLDHVIDPSGEFWDYGKMYCLIAANDEHNDNHD